ncbi:MAG: sigma-54 dependent transcriptional regulator [Gammaproteobacteria bacterium]|nr:sigma-54 dependent transcriptional regulator [Gammaproteobacteria bacterium]
MTNVDVLIVEDDDNLREALTDTLLFAGYSVVAAENGQAALARFSEQTFRMLVTDVQMQPIDGMALLSAVRKQNQQIPVVVMTAYGTIEKAVDAMRLGASDYLVKPFEADALLEVVQRLLPEAKTCQIENSELIVNEEKMQSLKAMASRVAKTDATVLLCGESGVGKEVFARYIHNQSPRADEAFVAINCAAIPENMLESILFGYEKGAFTGAHQAHPGKFEQAQGGTLLLDEISEMDVSLQAKLLRVLQEKEVERLGSRKTISLNVRVLATTNKNLREEVSAGRFREDLFYRLSVFPVFIPALRDRITDIMPIAESLLDKYKTSPNQTISLTLDAQQKMISHQWEGNVRELENVIQRAMILKDGDEIRSEHVFFETQEMFNSDLVKSAQDDSQDSVLVSDLKDREQQLILEALRAGDGSRKYAAERLGISPRTLRYKLARMRDVGIAV